MWHPRRASSATRASCALLATVSLLSPPTRGAGQTPPSGPAAQPPPTGETLPHRESRGDAPAPERPRVTSPPAINGWREGRYVSVQANVDANGMNIVGDAANEPSIAVDPTNPSRIAIGWRQFNSVASNFRQAGWAYSDDAGRTWTFPGVLEDNVFRSDPVLEADADGNFYYNSLQSTFYCDVFKSTDGGRTWPQRRSAFGGDKQWMAIDRSNGVGRGHIYCSWQNGSTPFAPSTFTRSEAGGLVWDGPFTLPATSNYGVLSVGPDGTVYQIGTVYGTTQFNVIRSTDAKNPGSWPTFSSFGVNLNGTLAFNVAPNPEGLSGQPWIAVNPAPGPYFGHVYILSAIDPPGDDPMDIHFVRSTDGGATWSSPIRVNQDPAGVTAAQWFGTLSVAPNGRLDAVWIDSRGTGNVFYGRLYYSYSTDDGQTWSTNEPLTPIFDSSVGWPQQNKMGDYYDMQSDNAGASLAYAATFNNEEDVYYLRIGLHDCNNNSIDDAVDIADGTSADCNGNEVPDECEPGGAADCNANGVADLCDIANGTSTDCNHNHVPDECDIAGGASTDCNHNGIPDNCEVGGAVDCNGNGVSDLCDIANGTSADCTGNGIPDECEPDCNNNGIVDTCEVQAGLATDCNNNGVPDDCDISPVAYSFSLSTDPGWTRQGQWGFGQPTGGGQTGRRDPTSGNTGPNVYGYNLSGLYPNNMTTPEFLTTKPLNLQGRFGTQLVFWRWLGVQGFASDKASIEATVDDKDWGTVWVNGNSNLSENAWSQQTYDLSFIVDNQPYVRIRWGMGPTNATQQYQGWNIDDIEIRSNPRSGDCNHNGIPDECDIANGLEPDCNHNGVPDQCDIGTTDTDCNGNGIPDRCDIASGVSGDCDNNGLLDVCEIAAGAPDCDHNGIPDSCEIASGEHDCNHNGVLDACDILAGASADCDHNLIPDECELAALTAFDCNGNGVLDVCDVADGDSPDCNHNGQPDECDVGGSVVSVDSPVYRPLGAESPHTYTLSPAPDAIGPLTFILTARGDLNTVDEYVSVVVNGVTLGVAYVGGIYFDCADQQIDTLTVPAAAFNAAKAGPTAAITLAPSADVNPNPPDCPNVSYIQFRMSYVGVPSSADANHNGIPDECEQPALCRGDCNCDGVVDFADIDPFVAALGGLANWPYPNCPWLSADTNGDGNVDFADIDPFVALIGDICP